MAKFKTLRLLFVASLFQLGVGCGNENAEVRPEDPEVAATTPATTETVVTGTTEDKGNGRHQHVELSNPPDEQLVAKGKGIYEAKCSNCHKLTTEQSAGPGWENITQRRTPEWIMNFATSEEQTAKKDEATGQALKACPLRLPNQALNDGDARAILEFMRKNDERAAASK